MHFCSYVSSIADIEELNSSEFLTEVLIEPREFAFEGAVSVEQAVALAKKANEVNLASVLVWDVLMTQAKSIELFELIEKTNLQVFSAIRVRDLGAAQFIFENYPSIDLQFIVEANNHNLDGLLAWCEYFGSQLKRLILSIELPEAKLIEYCTKLPLGCEVLGAGRIEIFYTPRGLLSANFESNSNLIEVSASSKDSGQRPFPIVETEHGTKMYLDKDQFILDKLDGLLEAGIESIRIDCKHLSSDGLSSRAIAKLCDSAKQGQVSRKDWPRKTLAPFFKTNKTTARFSKLKSPLHVLRDESCLAQMVYGQKGKFLVFYSLRDFDAKLASGLVLTTGEEISLSELSIRSSEGDELDAVGSNQLFLTPWVSKASNGALLKGSID